MSTSNLVSSLMNHGKSLAKQLDQAKTIPKPAKNNIYNEVEKVINGLIQDLDEFYQDEYVTQECFDKVVRKTISSLEELQKHDDPRYMSKYEDLVTKAGKFCISTSTDVSPTLATSAPTHDNNNNNHVQDTDNFNLSSYKMLNHPQKSLLDLFGMLPRGTNIKKNDLLLWWSALYLHVANFDPRNFYGEESEFGKHLRELVTMKMIEPVALVGVETIRKINKREGFKYKMPNVIWSLFHDKGTRIEKINSLSVSNYGVIVNTDASNLTTKRLKILIKRRPLIWMKQLGNWNHDPTKYIVTEDMESLTKVLNTKSSPLIFFLSLEGVSGLVRLPCFDGIYLEVLILKGCHNLESIPRFNTMSMKHLQYLDMSECYQLDHPVNVLDGCTMLRVVKGFVLPHHQQQQQPRPNNDSFISNPSQFAHLLKLTLRTRRFNFPTNSDLETLCELQSLTHLKITWVGACSGGDHTQPVHQFDDNAASKFPPKLTKFEMEAASDDTSTKILDLIAQQRKTNTSIPLKKLYIKGGNLSKLNPEVECKILRLHYLPKMEFDCYDMMQSFPDLHRLEMSKDVMYSMLRRSFQKATGTNDQSSGWEPSLNPRPSPPSAS